MDNHPAVQNQPHPTPQIPSQLPATQSQLSPSQLPAGQPGVNNSTKSKRNYKKIASIIFLIITLIFFLSGLGIFLFQLFQSHDFELFGYQFDVQWDGLLDTFGLKSKDFVEFNIDIRSEDSENDCKIKGTYMANNLTELDIVGDGELCKQLKEDNNKEK